eukprot:Trichotokara_eunicae@DN4067_c0_g1_i1.p1
METVEEKAQEQIARPGDAPFVGYTRRGGLHGKLTHATGDSNDEPTPAQGGVTNRGISKTPTDEELSVEEVDQSQLATRYVRNVPVSNGIPVAVVQDQMHWTGLVFWTVFLSIIWAILTSYLHKFVLFERVPLRQNLTVRAKLRNCAASFVKAPGNESFMELRSWSIGLRH